MKKYVLGTFNTENLYFDMWGFETYEDAYAEMKSQYNDLVKELDGFVTDNEIYEDSAYVATIDENYEWKIKEL